MAKETVLLCAGKSCRRALAESDRAERFVARLPVAVGRVRCQKVCKGPVVGVRVDGEWLWFERMNSRKALEALAALVAEGRLAKPLARRRDRKRTGRLRA